MTPSASWLAYLLAAAAFAAPLSESGRPYHRVPLDQIHHVVHTHVCTTGVVTEVHKEADGDVHIRVEDPASPGAFIVAEIIPTLRPKDSTVIRIPKKDNRIEVCGVTRYDKKHLWWELHPVERLR